MRAGYMRIFVICSHVQAYCPIKDDICPDVKSMIASPRLSYAMSLTSRHEVKQYLTHKVQPSVRVMILGENLGPHRMRWDCADFQKATSSMR